MGKVRAFIAIELPTEVKSSLSGLIENLRPGRERAVKWVNPKSIHLTLKFLGDIPERQLVDITSALAGATEGLTYFDLKLEGIGAFPGLKAPRVVWAGIGGDISKLMKLQKQVEQSLVPLGFTPEKREFSAHLTLGRVRENATHLERADLGLALGKLTPENASPFTVSRVSLMQSTLTHSGAIYNQLASIALDKNKKNMIN